MAEAPGSGSPQHHSNAPTGLKDPWGHADALIQTMRWIRTKNGEPLGASRFNHDTPHGRGKLARPTAFRLRREA
jgi:hypothetical protein